MPVEDEPMEMAVLGKLKPTRENDARVQALSALVAAISILERSHAEKKPANMVVASDKMFKEMLKDYRKAEERLRNDIWY